MIACYIIYSTQIDTYYTGITQESVKNRVGKHNQSTYGNTYSSKANDWAIFYIIECETVSQALKIEKHIKNMKSRTYIENLKKYKELTDKLLLKYK